MSFSNNSSRTILKEDAYGTNLTLTGKLVCSDISNVVIDQTINKLDTNCTGTNLTLSGTLASAAITTTTATCKNILCDGIEIGDGTTNTLTIIDMKTKNGHHDYDARIGVDGGSSAIKGGGSFLINAGSCAINAPLTVDSISTPGDIEALNGSIKTDFLVSNFLNVGQYNGDYEYSFIDMKTKKTATAFDVRLGCTLDNPTSGLGHLTVTSNQNTFSGKTSVINTLNCYRLEVGEGTPDSSSSIDMKAYGGNTDYDARIIVSGGQSSTSGKGDLAITAKKCTINAPLYVEGSLALTGNLSVNTISITPTELGYLSGLSSNIQAQINSFTTTSINSTIAGYISTLTSNAQDQLNALKTKHNNSYYYQYKGFNYFGSGRTAMTTTYVDYDKNLHTFQSLPNINSINFTASDVNAICITYAYYSDVINGQYQGITKTYLMQWHDLSWNQSKTTVAGADHFAMTYSIDTSGSVAALKITNNILSGSTEGTVNWTLTIEIY